MIDATAMQQLEWLLRHNFIVTAFDEGLLKKITGHGLNSDNTATGKYMLFDPIGGEGGYLLIGDNLHALLAEAHAHFENMG